MKTLKFSMLILYIFIIIYGSLFAQGERTIVLGGSSGWRSVEIKNSVAEVMSVRPHPVLALSSASGSSTAGYTAAYGVWGNMALLNEPALDMSISFDEKDASFYRDSKNRYSVTASGNVETIDIRYARAGTGAALFGNNGNIKIKPLSRDSLFSAGGRIRDFTIEFWLHPLNMENGEEILSWTSTIDRATTQKIVCTASKNRLSWSFENFFASTQGNKFINLELTGRIPVVPKKWSHHLIRFDATSGMIEYIADGVSEAIFYATSTGNENGEVFTPIAGNNGFFTLGQRFTGMIDEFKIHEVFAGRSTMQRYPAPGGRAESRPIDLGEKNSGVTRVNISGGRMNIKGTSRNIEFYENGKFLFADDSQLSFYIRSNENAFLLNRSPWIRFTPGSDISGINGRYVQIAVDFYPSRDGETSPYLYEIKIIYRPGEPPLPPRNVTAVAADGGVMLRWRNSSSENITGYLIYYSEVRDELFGTGALLGPSPVNVGNRNSIFIEGLKNGTLYYFRIAAYDEYNTGEFSAEVTARPLAGLSFSDLLY